uniref:Uncharacterized protein n=1 Tax=Arundo donax TaxID=35708 RepID=A0A0A9EHA1_ARUDO
MSVNNSDFLWLGIRQRRHFSTNLQSPKFEVSSSNRGASHAAGCLIGLRTPEILIDRMQEESFL